MEKKAIGKMSEKRREIGALLKVTSEFLELLFAFLILIGIILRLVDVPQYLQGLISGDHSRFTVFIDYIIDSVIGVELVHLLCQPNLDSVVEILLVAITREIITLEGDATSTLLYVAALGVLFLLRRFMFVDKLDRHDGDFSVEALKKHLLRRAGNTERPQETQEEKRADCERL